MSGPKATQLSLKISGVYSSPNPFSEVPQGISLAACSNMVIDRDSILNSRRGQSQYGVSPDGTTLIKAMFDFKDTLLLADANGKISYDVNDDGSVWGLYSGTYLPPSGLPTDRVRSFQSNKNLYILSSNGVYKLSSVSSSFRTSGVSRGLGGSGTTTGASGFMGTNTNVAYRIVWGYRDENNNLILGAPSDRIIVSNSTGGDRDVSLTFFIPADIDTTYFYQIYRSTDSATVNDQPDDELQLVDELTPSAGEITAGTITYVDATPDDLRGVIIYTAPSLSTEGILGANVQPPFATVACSFGNAAFYGNTRTKHSLTVTLIGTDAPLGVQVGDTLTIADGAPFTITGAAVENAVAGQFLVETALTPAENIAATARSIVSVLNTITANTTIAAYYTSGFDELPGQMFFERLTLTSTPFTVTSSRATCWRPELPASGASYNNTSRNEELPNRVYFSKLQQPEAVPVLQYLDIGSPEEPILAMNPLRDGVLILKTDGVYRITGSTPATIAVTPIDTTVRIVAPYSTATLGNKVFFFSTQGVVAASDSGVEIVSRPIETELLELSSAQYPNFNSITFAAGYESDRKMVLYTVTTSSDTYATQAFVFDILSGEWTRWTKPASAAIIKQDNDTLYTVGPAANEADSYVFKERKNFNLSDFADEQYSLALTGVTGLTLDVDDTSLLEVGYTLQQTLGSARIVTIVSGTQVTVDSIQDWVIGDPLTAFRPIYQSWTTNQFSASNPSEMKHWADLSIVYKSTDFTTMTIGVTADTTNENREVTLTAPTGSGGWGTFPWGTLPWGVSRNVKARLRTSIPKQAMRSNWIAISGTLNECFTDMNVAGIAITYSTMSSRVKGSSR